MELKLSKERTAKTRANLRKTRFAAGIEPVVVVVVED